MFWFFDREAYGILDPRPGIEPASPALEGEVLTPGPPGKSLGFLYLWLAFISQLGGLFHPQLNDSFIDRKTVSVVISLSHEVDGTFPVGKIILDFLSFQWESTQYMVCIMNKSQPN